MFRIDKAKFPVIKQICDEWCVLACIENILKFYGEYSYDQLDLYREFPLNLGHPYFEKICEKFGVKIQNFMCNRENIQDIDDYIRFLEEKIKNNTPVIISTESGSAAHALIPIGFGSNNFLFFNPAKKEPNFFRIQYNQLPNLLGSHRDILLIEKV